MPRRYSLAGDLGEAIRRGGAGFAGALEDIARQKTEKEQFDQLFGLRTDAADLSRKRFEAGRSDADRTFDLSESKETRAGLLFDIQHPVGPQLADPLTIEDIEDQIAREAFEAGGAKGFRSSQRRRAESTRAEAKVTKPIVTPLQLKKLIDDRGKEQQRDIIARANAYDLSREGKQGIKSIGGLEETAGMGAFFTPGQPVRDETAFNFFRDYKQARSTESEQARIDSALTGQLFPGLEFGREQTPAGLEPQQDIDSIGRATYDDWDQLTDAQKQEIARRGFPAE